MIKFLKNLVLFGLKVLFLAYLFALLEELINKVVFWIYDLCTGITPEERENLKMEQYYKEHGIHCPSCDKWYPISFEKCPLCKRSISLLQTVNKQLEITDGRRLQ